MEILIYALSLLGIHYDTLNPSLDPFIILFAVIMFFCIIGLMAFTNILIYLLSLHITDMPYLLNKFSKYPFLLKGLKWYRTTRFFYIFIEVCLFYISIGCVIIFCFILLSEFSNIH